MATKVTGSGKKTTATLVALKKVLVREPKDQRQTAEQMKGTLAVLAAQYGIPLRRRGHD